MSTEIENMFVYLRFEYFVPCSLPRSQTMQHLETAVQLTLHDADLEPCDIGFVKIGTNSNCHFSADR